MIIIDGPNQEELFHSFEHFYKEDSLGRNCEVVFHIKNEKDDRIIDIRGRIYCLIADSDSSFRFGIESNADGRCCDYEGVYSPFSPAKGYVNIKTF